MVTICLAIAHGQPAFVALIYSGHRLKRPEAPLHDGRRILVQSQVALVTPGSIQGGTEVLPQLQRRVTGGEIAHHRTDALFAQQPGSLGLKVGQPFHLIHGIGYRLIIGLPGVEVLESGRLGSKLQQLARRFVSQRDGIGIQVELSQHDASHYDSGRRMLLNKAGEVGVQVQGLDERRFARLDTGVDLAFGAGDE